MRLQELMLRSVPDWQSSSSSPSYLNMTLTDLSRLTSESQESCFRLPPPWEQRQGLSFFSFFCGCQGFELRSCLYMLGVGNRGFH